MSFRSMGLAASLALAANAFMIPSTLSLPGAGVQTLDPARVLSDASAKVIKLPCPGCSFDGPAGDENTENDMLLTWSIGQEGKVLLLNGQEFYGSEHPMWPISFPTSQVAAETSVDDVRERYNELTSKPRDMFYHVVERFVNAADGTDAQLIDIDFSVNSLGSEPVKGADSLTLRVLKDEAGLLTIADVVQVPADPTKAAHEHGEPAPEKAEDEEEGAFNILPVDQTAPPSMPLAQKIDCEGRMASLCRLRAMMQHQLEAMRGAMHMTGHRLRIMFIGKPQMRPHHRPCNKGGHGGPHGVHVKGGMPKFWRLGAPAAAADQSNSSPSGPPKHHGHHGPHPHRFRCNRMGRFLHVVRRVFFGFIVPVLIGVAAGMTASLLGMVVGTGLAMFWIRCVRGGRRGNASAIHLEAAKHEAVVDGAEKEALMRSSEDEQQHEELPAYEDAPAYAEKEVQ